MCLLFVVFVVFLAEWVVSLHERLQCDVRMSSGRRYFLWGEPSDRDRYFNPPAKKHCGEEQGKFCGLHLDL